MINKYHAKKIKIDGIQFDSKSESERYSELLILQKAGVIKNLVLQPKFELQASFKYQGKAQRAIYYIADFQYETKDGKIIVEDVKGMETTEFKIKKKMFLKRYGDKINFQIIKVK